MRDCSASDLIALAWHGALGEHAAVVKSVLGEADCPVMLLRAGGSGS